MDYRPAMGAACGIGRYTRALADALCGNGCDLRLFGVFLRGNRRAVRRAPAGARLVAWPVPSRVMGVLGAAGILPADRALGGCDVYHHTNFLLAPVGRRTPQVMTIHDLAFRRDPACHTPRAVAALEEVVRRASRRCAAFLVPSEATARDCEELLGLPRDRLHVTPLGVGPEFFALEPRRPRRPYLLAVGTLEPRKNFARLIRSFDRAGVEGELRIAGGAGWLCDDVQAEAAGRPHVRLLGPVPEPELHRLLAGATAVLYPSLLEGFGLPVLEALAAGRPVLTSDREPLRSLAGGAAVLADPEDEEALAAGIRRVVAEGAAHVAAGRERARAFPWEACARATRQAYEAVVG